MTIKAEGLTNEQIESAYRNLADSDRAVIDALAKTIEDNMHSRRTGGKGFERLSALELLAKLGIWMIENKYTEAAKS